MKFNLTLFWWQFRRVSVSTCLFALLMIGVVLLMEDPLQFTVIDYGIVLAHCFWLTRRIARPRSDDFALLYSQGFPRDSLWLNTVLATVVSALVVWLPVAMLVWLPLRSAFQDANLNPWYPLLADMDRPYALWMLLAYSGTLPVFHYEWIRSAVPERGMTNGNVLSLTAVLTVLIVLFICWDVTQRELETWAVVSLSLVGSVSPLLLVAGWKLHRRVEVHS